jgi:hypothetical protein
MAAQTTPYPRVFSRLIPAGVALVRSVFMFLRQDIRHIIAADWTRVIGLTRAPGRHLAPAVGCPPVPWRRSIACLQREPSAWDHVIPYAFAPHKALRSCVRRRQCCAPRPPKLAGPLRSPASHLRAASRSCRCQGLPSATAPRRRQTVPARRLLHSTPRISDLGAAHRPHLPAAARMNSGHRWCSGNGEPAKRSRCSQLPPVTARYASKKAFDLILRSITPSVAPAEPI